MVVAEPSLGVCYYPEHWPQEEWAHDAARMAECGISYVRIAEFAWSRFEPARDQLEFDWLDTAIKTLGDAGLKIVMCTPTATPPKWLVDEMPDMVAVDANGHPRKWGSRRHYDFSHLGYRKEAARITEILAKRYGKNPHIIAWQTDNEYGCHDTTLSYSDCARDGFRDWLAQKYQSPDALNRAWGNAFWSMEVGDFSQVELPNLTVTEANPSHVMDFRRFASDQVVAFNKVQTEILRKLSPGRDLIHNFMGNYLEFDHYDVSEDLDIASWDSYPIGMLERDFSDPSWKAWYFRSGDPDMQAFHHDLYRGCTAEQRMWIMEQQPGPVNWAEWNPAPHAGMVRLWSHEAFAHGAEVVSYFRWRQAPFAQEQFHSGLLRSDGSEDLGYGEAKQVGEELRELPQAQTAQSKVALMFDYPSIWAVQTQPQGADFNGFELVREFYSALRKNGQSVDVISPKADLEGYKLIVIPQLLMVDDALVERLKKAEARVIFGPRCGSRTPTHQIPENLAPGPLQDLLPMKVLRVESLRPGCRKLVGQLGTLIKWAEFVEPGEGVETRIRTMSDRPVWLGRDGISYIAGWPNPKLLMEIIRSELDAAGIPIWETGEDLRVRDRGNLRTIVNYGPRPCNAGELISQDDEILVGGAELDIAGVTVVRRR